MIRKLFLQNNIWLLSKGTIDDYIVTSLKKDEKLSIDKLNEIFYPGSIKELKSFLINNKINEFEKIAEEILKIYIA